VPTIPEWWTDPYPEVSSVRAATDYLDTLGGALSRTQENGGWRLLTGQQELITTGSPEELDTFVLGFALAHLICERRGLLGRQAPEPTPLPHPRDLAVVPPIEAEKDDGGDEGMFSEPTLEDDERDEARD
jgi:hypothetical protein